MSSVFSNYTDTQSQSPGRAAMETLRPNRVLGRMGQGSQQTPMMYTVM